MVVDPTMNILPWKEFVLGTLLLLSLGHCAVAASSGSKDAETNDLSLSGLADEVAKIPDIGPYLKDLLNYLGETLMLVNQLLNSIIARLLGGSLPCALGAKEITCSGTSTEGGVFGIVEDLVNQLVLPDVVKKMLLDLIKRTLNPIIDALFGGLPLAKPM